MQTVTEWYLQMTEEQRAMLSARVSGKLKLYQQRLTKDRMKAARKAYVCFAKQVRNKKEEDRV